MKKTEIVVREDNTVYGEYDYIDNLKFRLDIINGKIKEKLFYRNQHGGISPIDEYGTCHHTYNPFGGVTQLFSKIVNAQIEKRIKNDKKRK